MKKILLYGSFLGGLLSTGLFGAEALKQAKIVEFRNQVIMTHDKKPVLAKVDGIIEGKDSLQTGKNSRAELEFADSSLARLGSNTIFSFDPEAREMTVDRGEALIHVPPNKGGLRISTPSASAAIVGDTIFVEVDENGGTKFSSLSRDPAGPMEVFLKNGGRKGSGQALEAGHSIEVPKDAVVVPKPKSFEVASMFKANPLITERPLPDTARGEIETAFKVKLTPRTESREKPKDEAPKGEDPGARGGLEKTDRTSRDAGGKGGDLSRAKIETGPQVGGATRLGNSPQVSDPKKDPFAKPVSPMTIPQQPVRPTFPQDRTVTPASGQTAVFPNKTLIQPPGNFRQTAPLTTTPGSTTSTGSVYRTTTTFQKR